MPFTPEQVQARSGELARLLGIDPGRGGAGPGGEDGVEILRRLSEDMTLTLDDVRRRVDGEAGRGSSARGIARLGISGAAAPTTAGIDYSHTPGRTSPLNVQPFTGNLDRHPDFPEFFRLARELVWEEFAPRYERAVSSDNAGAAERIQARIDELARQRAIVTLRAMVDGEAGRGSIARALARAGIAGAAGESRTTPPPGPPAPPTVGIDYGRTPGRESPLNILTRMSPSEMMNLLDLTPADLEEAVRNPPPEPADLDRDRTPAASSLEPPVRQPPRLNDRPPPPAPGPSVGQQFHGLGMGFLNPLGLTPPPVTVHQSPGQTLTGRVLPPTPRTLTFETGAPEAEEAGRLLSVAGPAGRVAGYMGGRIASGARTAAEHVARNAAPYGLGTAGVTTVAGAGQTQPPDQLDERLRRSAADDERLITTMTADLQTHQAALKELQSQRAAALAEMRAQREGKGGAQAGMGPRYRAQEEAITRLDNQITELSNNTITPLARQLAAARERLTPEYRERQRQIFRAEGERDRILADAPRPFRDEYPGLTRAYFMAPFLGGALVASFMRLRPAFSQNAQVGRWWEAVRQAQTAADPTARAAALARAEQFERALPPHTWRDLVGYYSGPMVGGASVGAALSNVPELRDIFTLPYEDPRRRALEEYIKLLPADHPEMQRLVQRLATMNPNSNPDLRSAIEHFTRISPAFVRALEGAMGGMAGAELVTTGSHALSRYYESAMPRPETRALLGQAGRDNRLPWTPPRTREIQLEEVSGGRGTGHRNAATGHWATREDVDLWYATRRGGRPARTP